VRGRRFLSGAAFMNDSTDAGEALERRARILIVEDNPDTAMTMSALLEELQCETMIAIDGAEAIAKGRPVPAQHRAARYRPAHMNGYEVAQALAPDPQPDGGPDSSPSPATASRRTNRKPTARESTCT